MNHRSPLLTPTPLARSAFSTLKNSPEPNLYGSFPGCSDIMSVRKESTSVDSTVERFHRESISEVFDTRPPSQQIVTNIAGNRPREEFLIRAAEMGFTTEIAEKAFGEMLEQYDGDPEGFTTEECIQHMLKHSDLNEEQSGLVKKEEDDMDGVELVVDSDQKAPEDDQAATQISGSMEIRMNDQSGGEVDSSTSEDPYAREEREDADYTGTRKTCVICASSKPPKRFFEGQCGHSFCRLCIGSYYCSQIDSGVVSMKCMDDSCERAVKNEEVAQFIDKEHLAKLERFTRNIQLAKDPNVRWCVKPGCDTPLFRKSKKQKKLTCDSCGESVCFDCAAPWHGQDACDTVLDDKLNQWCKTDTRDVQFCPSCSARIEKLEGCNHMSCHYCKYEFCWLCRRQFKKGHYDRSNLWGGCPGGENADKRPNTCRALCSLMSGCCLTCLLPLRVYWWHMQEQGLPWCLCWYCCDD